MQELKTGVIGTGHLGSIHTRLWKENKHAKLEGIFDIDTEKVEKLSSDYSCRAFASLDEAIDNCDALTIASPTQYHFDIAMECINKGKHCLIEKPITATYAEAEKLIAAAESKNVQIQVGHVERFNPALAAVKQYNPAPLFIEAHRLAQFKPRATDVSVIHDLMIHDIDIMLWLMNDKVTDIDASAVAVLTDTPDIANARIKFSNGAVANLTASRISANPMRKLRFFQKDAYISIDFAKPDVEVFRLFEEGITPGDESSYATMLGTIEAGLKNKNIYYEKPVIHQINAIAEEQNAFADSIMNGAKIAVSAREAAEALRIAEEIISRISS